MVVGQEPKPYPGIGCHDWFALFACGAITRMPLVVPDDYYSNGTRAHPEQQMIWKASHIGPTKPTNVEMELLRLC
jgi:hypothetical protein